MGALNLVAPINSSGYGIVAFNLLRAFAEEGVDVSLFPTEGGAFPDLQLSLTSIKLLKTAVSRQALYPLDAPCLRLTPEFSMTLFAGRGPRAGLPFFETDTFSERDLHHLGSLDHLLVPSEWARSVVDASTLRGPRVSVVPMGVDQQIFQEREIPVGEETVFLQVGKWERRKGQDFLLEAFSRAFVPGDPVRLDLMCHNPYLEDRNEEWVARCRESPMADHLRILPRVAGADAVAKRMQAADCGVFPARAEGWNLELLEMMACGKTVIATDYAGHTAFATPDNCRLIDVDRLEPAVDERYHQIYGRDKIGRWAHLGRAQLEQTVEHLRAVHAAKQAGRSLRNIAGLETAREHTWQRCADTVAEALGI